ncbi:MAG TPA: nitroreductase family protein, partial [Rectinemataceae bacterium]|nr:nitroreductase family protein [Rectinemataceae bacterium]
PDAVSSASKAGRTIPYSGDVAYLNLYLLTPKGAYLYQPDKSALKQVSAKDERAAITSEFIKTSPFMILYVADTAKAPSFLKGNKAMLREMMNADAGFAAENVGLVASSLKLGSIIMYNIKPADAAGLLGMGKEEIPLFVMQFGYTQ